jgi:voltage-gated sodium channel
MGHVIALLSLLLYVYGIMGFHLFGRAVPEYWGSLRQSVETLFQILTLEGWVEVAQKSQPAHPVGWLFFTSFIVVAVFVVTNLFIAVVINNLDRVRAEQARAEDAAGVHHELIARIETLKQELNELEATLRSRAP